MQLSKKALDELKVLIEKEGKDDVQKLSDSAINGHGIFLLRILAYGIKRRSREAELGTMNDTV